MESEIGVISACIKGNFSEINDYLKDGGNLELKDRVSCQISLFF